MKVVYAKQVPPESWSSAIFLAGPTPRADTALPSWRPEALTYLKELGYAGVVFVPEDENGTWHHSYDDQVEWEEMCLNFADVILFWIPRDIQHMPGFTTNDEWGFWKAKDSMKLVLGTPEGAPKVRYQRYYAEKQHIPVHNTLQETCAAAIKKQAGAATIRTDGERYVPLHIWRTLSFQSWYEHLVNTGNRLDGARVEWVFRSGPTKQRIFAWVLHVDIYIAAEDRHKTNEVVIGRSDISAILLYERCSPLQNSRIVLVKEFRSAVSNDAGYVFELVGGSSWDEAHNPLQVAAEECHEEVGLRLALDRFRMHQSRQLAATALTHRAHLFSAELTTVEMDQVVQNAQVVYGAAESSERTWGIVTTYRDVFNNTAIDWSMLGMIVSVLRE